MSKVIRIAAIVVGVVAITVATAGIGTAPAIAASGTGLGAVAGASAVGASLFGLSVGTLTAIGTGLSLASSLLAKRPGAGSAVGSPVNWKSDTGAAMPYWIGRTMNAGSIVARQGYHGNKNTDQTFVTVYSGAGPIAGFDQFLVDNVPTTFTGYSPSSGVNNAANGPLNKYAWLNSQVGNQPEPLAFVPPNAAMPGWSAASKLSGLAATMFTVYFDEKGKVFPSGLPKLATVGRGVRVYDPRADSTYPGGSGAQRWNNEATWAYSENPWLHALTWAIGRHSNGIRTLGVGMSISSIDVDAFVQAANVADANGWKVGGVVGSTDDKWNVLKQMCQAGGGEPLRQAATLSCFVNTPKVSLAVVTAADLADGDISFPAMQPRRSRINSVIPTYRSEDHDWEVVPGTVVQGGTYVTEDGETRTRQIDYPLVQCFAGQQPVQAAQLAAYDVVNAREYGPIPIPLKPQWIRFRNGDCLTLNIPDANLVNQDAIILQRGIDPASAAVSLTFRSETTAKHAFALGKTTTAPPTPSISAPPTDPYWSDPNATFGAPIGSPVGDIGAGDVSGTIKPGGGVAAGQVDGNALQNDSVRTPTIVDGTVSNIGAFYFVFNYQASTGSIQPISNAGTTAQLVVPTSGNSGVQAVLVDLTMAMNRDGSTDDIIRLYIKRTGGGGGDIYLPQTYDMAIQGQNFSYCCNFVDAAISAGTTYTYTPCILTSDATFIKGCFFRTTLLKK